MKKQTLRTLRNRLLMMAAGLFTMLSTSFAQSFTEGFDDISLLSGNGWFLQNNSSPLGTTSWVQGDATVFPAYTGAANSYIYANFYNTSGWGTISNWLLTPNRTIRNGDVLTFYTRKPSLAGGVPDYPDRLEVRLSTNGASTNVGVGASATGDFTTLLLSINPTLTVNVYPQTWTQYTVTVSGLPAPTSGRFAFRYFVTSAGPLGSNSDYIGIDQVVYTPYVCPAFTMTTGGALTGGVAGSAYTESLTQTGALGTPSYAVTSGALPPGITLSYAGVISGTPTATGTFNFSVTVSDASGCSGTESYSITVLCPASPVIFNPVSVCSDAAPFTLSATPAGGAFSGVGVSGGLFNPAAGTQVITYDYTDPYGCAFPSIATITVNDVPVVDAGADVAITCGGAANIGAAATSTMTLQLEASASSFYSFLMDEVYWTITNTASVVVASGGPYGFYDGTVDPPIVESFSLNPAEGPFLFNISTVGFYNDNDVDYQFSCGSTVVASGNVFGGSTSSTSISACAPPIPTGSVSWLPVAGLNDATIASPSAAPVATTGYELSVTDVNGCVGKDSVYVTVNPLTGVDVQSFCVGSSYTFNGTVYTQANNTATDTFVTSSGCDSVVTLNLSFNNNGMATASTSGSAVQYNDSAFFADASCNSIGAINSTDDLGSITMNVTIGAYPGGNVDPFVDRYFDIQTSNPGGGTVTLYFTQQEIDDYNTLVSGNSNFPQIGTMGENLQITAFHSAPGSGTGPGGYDPGSSEVISCVPVWNAIDNRWEVTFTTAAFSGFFLHTKTDGSPLPIRINSISATNKGAVNIVDWKSTTEAVGDQFEVQRSVDGRSFAPIGSIAAKGISGSVYQFTDQQPFDGINYYRLHLINKDGSSNYSKVVTATVNTGNVLVDVFPNPADNILNIRVTGTITGKAHAIVTDVAGRVVHSVQIEDNGLVKLDISELAAGVYLLRYSDDVVKKEFKVVKQ